MWYAIKFYISKWDWDEIWKLRQCYMPYTEQVTTFDCLYPYKCTITGMKFYSSLVEFFL